MSEHQSMLVPSWFSQALGNCINLSLTLVSISSTGEKLALAFERAPTAQGASLPRQMHPQKLEKHVFQHKAQHLLAGSCAPLTSGEAASSADLVGGGKHAVSPMSLLLLTYNNLAPRRTFRPAGGEPILLRQFVISCSKGPELSPTLRVELLRR